MGELSASIVSLGFGMTPSHDVTTLYSTLGGEKVATRNKP